MSLRIPLILAPIMRYMHARVCASCRGCMTMTVPRCTCRFLTILHQDHTGGLQVLNAKRPADDNVIVENQNLMLLV